MDAYDRGHDQNYHTQSKYPNEPREAQSRRRGGGGKARGKQKGGAKNAGILAASVVALWDEDVAGRLHDFRRDQTASIAEAIS